MTVTSPKCQLQLNRANYMQFLYKLYRRFEAEPGLVGTYTGLYQQHCQEIGQETVDLQIAHWHLTAEVISFYVP